MTIFGFAKHKGENVSFEAFFRSNLCGFARFKGIVPENVRFSILRHDNPNDMVIYGDRTHIDVAINARLRDEILGSSPVTASFVLWDVFIKCLRVWYVTQFQIPIAGLLPPPLLASMPDTEIIIKTLDDCFTELDWTIEYLRMQYDSSIIAHYIALLVVTDTYGPDRPTETEVAELVFGCRNHNWNELTGLE